MAVAFRIPKSTDREIVAALGRIRESVKSKLPLKITVNIQHQGVVEVPFDKPEEFTGLKYIFDENSQLINRFCLLDPRGQEAFIIDRQSDKISDAATVGDNWTSSIGDPVQRGQFHVALLAAARNELKASDIEAAFKGSADDAWTRYRDAQAAVVNSLQQATENLLIKASEQNTELDKTRSERFEKLETDLRKQLDKERSSLQETHESKLAELTALEKSLTERQASFDTKESHYVARQKQADQIKLVQMWLENCDLTKSTQAKREPIKRIYIIALYAFGALTVAATVHGYLVFDSAENIAKITWWQWAAIWVKAALPLAGFVTFMVYFIRWNGDWARQHSEEEFRNRTLLVDIGRASWLLEAVRDSQERNKEIPKELLHELSRNLFSHSVKTSDDIHPQAISDLLMQGLSSIRLKGADGAEVEATRGKKK